MSAAKLARIVAAAGIVAAQTGWPLVGPVQPTTAAVHGTGVTACVTFGSPPVGGELFIDDVYDEPGTGISLKGTPPTTKTTSSGGGAGKATFSDLNLMRAAGPATKVALNNIGMLMDVSDGPVLSFTLQFADLGGSVSLMVNDVLSVTDNLSDLDGSTLGGAHISVHTAGEEAGRIEVSGVLSKVMVGGQELVIDDWCTSVTGIPDPQEPPAAPYQKMDLGDAPDSANHAGLPFTNTAYAFPTQVRGLFPTTFDPATSPAFQGQGPIHARIDKYWLGWAVTAEREADLLPDSDAVTSILGRTASVITPTDVANMDKADDGWLNRASARFDHCQTTEIVVRVSRSTLALQQEPAYLNVWFDGDRDGDWKDFAQCDGGAGAPEFGYEWIIQNQAVGVAGIPAGGTQVFTFTTVKVMNTVPTPTHWLRFTLADRPINLAEGTLNLAAPDRGDGRGPANGYKLGETEDYLIETPPQPPQEDGKPDLGDAPDSSNHWALNNTAYSVPPTFGNFPTVWQGAAPSGPKHRNLNMSGWLGNAITPEFEADQGPDADVVNNIMNGGVDNANRDVADDGWLNPFVPFPHCNVTTLRVRVSRAASYLPPPNTPHYLNVWFDGNRDGDWQDVIDCPQTPVLAGLGGEWIVGNFVVNMTAIPAGGFVDLNVPTRRILNTQPQQNHWVRFSLTEQPLTAANGTVVSTLVPAAPARADGRGLAHPNTWRQGETEDYFYKPHLTGEQPGVLKIEKGIMPHGFGNNTAGKVLTYFIEIDNAGGTIASTTTMTDPLPPQVVPVGLPMLSNPIPSAGSMAATLSGSLITWNGWMNPSSKVRIEQAVRVLPCWGANSRDISNTAYALQTSAVGGGLISSTAVFKENCKPVIWDNLDIKLTPSERAVLPGDILSVTLEAKNNGSEDVWLRTFCCTLNGLPPGEPIIRGVTRTLSLARGEEIDATEAMTVNRCCRGHVTILKIAAGSTGYLSGTVAVPASLQVPRQASSPVTDDEVNMDGILSITAAVHVIPPPEPGEGFTPEGMPAGCRERGDCVCVAGFSGDNCRIVETAVKFVNTDLGDAPDSSNHPGSPMTAYPGTPASYPTVFDPATGAPSGPRHHQPQHFHLGPRVSVERDADQLPDTDGQPNLRPPGDIKDRDLWDDGVALNLLAFEDCKVTKVPVRVFIDPVAKFWMTSTQKMGYINVWLDGNRDGDWQDLGQCPPDATGNTLAPEHIVINHAVNPASLALGLNNISVPTGLVKWPAGDAAKPAWLRVTLTTKPISLPVTGGVTRSDGRGEAYRLGETEDYLYRKDGQPNGAGNIWVKKQGDNVRMCCDSDRDGLGDTAESVWVITVGNEGSAPAQVNLRDTPPEGWSIARVRVIGPDLEPDIDPVEFARKGWDGTVKGSSALRATVVLTKWMPAPPHTPPSPFRVVITNTAVVTSPTDTDPGDNTAAATVELPDLAPPVIVEPGDGTTCSGTITATGWAMPGSTVSLWVDGAVMASGPANAAGKWSLVASGLLDGAYILSATYVISSVTSPASAPRSVTVDSSLSYDPLSVTFTDASGSSHHPQGTNGRTDDGGWALNLKPHTAYTISVRLCCAQDPNADVQVRFGPTVTVDLDDPDNDGVFTGVFTTGDRMNASMVISVLCAGIIRSSDGTVLIDPYGEVSDANTGALLAGATVTAHEFDGSAYNPWNAAAYAQINPQITLADGWYSFFTPPGTYQIAVTKPGYQPHRSLDIVVTNQLVRYDVALAPIPTGPVGGYVMFTADGPDPAVIKVKPGSVVVFVNASAKGIATYDLKAAKKLARGAEDPTTQGALLTGESISIQYDEKGVFTYDDGMRIGTVVVEDPAKVVFLPAVTR